MAAGDHVRLHRLETLGRQAGVPAVVTGDVLYHHPRRRILQDVATCIREGCTIDDADFRPERHLKPPEEMARLHARHPAAVERSLEIVARCSFSLTELRISYSTPELERVLGKTLGIPLFQEQAMQVAIVCAGFTPGEADQLRRAMATFKVTGGVSHFKGKLIEGMVHRKYERGFAEQTFSQIKGFVSYGFPESHAPSFALIAYASAWLKCHHPDVFCCALLNSQPMGFYASPRWCATPSSTRWRSGPSASTPAVGIAPWSRWAAAG